MNNSILLFKYHKTRKEQIFNSKHTNKTYTIPQTETCDFVALTPMIYLIFVFIQFLIRQTSQLLLY